MTLNIGIMGNIGSFSEEASLYYCHKNKIENYKFDYLITAEKVLRTLNSGEIDLGIFPIENSNGGLVYESIYAMAKYNFKIENIFEIDVKHFLLATPGKNISDIKKITSHPQALKQCRMYLKRRWEDTELQEYSDTASAAKDLSVGLISADTAVIAPKNCAELYGLDILDESIQDLKFNFTTFITASKYEE